MVKTRIYETDDGRVVLERDDIDGMGRPIRARRTYRGKPGRYVYELHPDGSTTQPCDELSSAGSALYCGPSLIETIRANYRRGRAAEKREEQRMLA